MMPSRTLPLHFLLAAVLILGGLPGLGDAAITAGSAGSAGSVDNSVTAGEQTGSHGDCHGDQTENETSGEQANERGCCDLGQDCNHAGCDCGCLALNLVIPIRQASETAIYRPAPPSSLTAVLERHATSPPIRPPKA